MNTDTFEKYSLFSLILFQTQFFSLYIYIDKCFKCLPLKEVEKCLPTFNISTQIFHKTKIKNTLNTLSVD